jgi:AraC-like DNA-binding protein
MVSQLQPDVALAPPLPIGVMVDQVGALLALVAGDAESSALSSLLHRIQDRLRERCSEQNLTADDVAASLDIPPRDLHRALATANLTFASQLLDMRMTLALQMLGSRSFDRLKVGEIGRKAGFLSPSHFARMVRKHTGFAPLQLRVDKAK